MIADIAAGGLPGNRLERRRAIPDSWICDIITVRAWSVVTFWFWIPYPRSLFLLLWTGQSRISTPSEFSLFAATNYLSLAIGKAWYFGLETFISRVLGNLNSTIVEGNIPNLGDRSIFASLWFQATSMREDLPDIQWIT